MRRQAQWFDERALSPPFGTFKAFARQAEAFGYVELRRAPDCPDFEIWATGSMPRTGGSGRVEPRPQMIRKDLWDAFNGIDHAAIRVYDREAGRAIKFNRQPGPGDHAGVREVRSEWSRNRSRFVEIEPIPLKSRLAWAGEFVETVSDPAARAALRLTLSAPRPLASFIQALKLDQHLLKLWRAHEIQRVAAWIEAWAQAETLVVDPFEQKPRVPRDGDPTDGGVTPPAPAETRGIPRDVAVRQRLHAAIDRMPVEELDRLQIPVRYLIES